MKNVLITETTGFIGKRLAHHLLDEGYEVSVLASDPSAADDLAGRGATIIDGDCSRSMALRRAMDDVDGVFHLAVRHALGSELGPMRRVDVQGTRNVLNAASDAGIERVVFCGSDTSLGNTRGEVCDESKEHDGQFYSVDERTKFEAHRLVEDCIEEGEPIINTIVSTVYGPGDDGTIGELIEHQLAGHAIAHIDPRSGYTFTHIDDVTTALRLAYERGEPGERYLIAGTPASFERFYEALSAQSNVPAPRGELPPWLIDLLKPLVERAAPFAGKTGDEVSEMLAMGRGVTRYYSGQKAREQLGWEPRSLAEGLRDTVPWYQRREKENAERVLTSTSIPLLGLSLFDIGLGISALVFPKLYMQLMHPHSDGTHPPAGASLLARTGLLWLFFAFVQGGAGLDPVKRPEWVLVAGALRLMDVPADIGYLLTSDDQGWLGKLGLIAAPVFNLSVGAALTYAGYRGLRAKLSS